MPRTESSPTLLNRIPENDTVVLREGLGRLFPAETSASFDDLLRAIDIAEADRDEVER